MLKFNMGCGHNKAPGFVNVDASPACNPDEVADLETTPWPWADDCADTVLFNHSLEHMGADSKVFLAIMGETYRILADSGEVIINVPHPRHDDFINDPTHVRIITPQLMSLFDRKLNDRWKEGGFANTPLSHYTGVDLEQTFLQMRLAPRYQEKLRSGELSEAQLKELMDERLNVVAEIKMRYRVRKPAGRDATDA